MDAKFVIYMLPHFHDINLMTYQAGQGLMPRLFVTDRYGSLLGGYLLEG